MAKKHKRKRRNSFGRTLLIALTGLVLVLAIALGFGMWAHPTDSVAALPSATAAMPTPSPEPTPSPVPATAVPMSTVAPFCTIAPTPEPERVNYKYPYLIVVNYKAQLVRIYTLDENGFYSVIVKDMLTSSGAKRICPTGVYKLYDKRRWISFLDGSYGQYSCRITGHFLFHSLPYSKNKDNSTLITKDYGELGQNTSGGCMRLMCKDAKWIYDNCPEGTPIIITEGEEVDPSVYDAIVQPPLVSGDWDPTDPDPDNPDYYDESDATPPPTCNPYVTPNPSHLAELLGA